MDKNEVFLIKLKEIFGDKYDYSLIEYINNRIKVKLICKKHGIFEKSPKHLLTGGGCQKCSKEKQSTQYKKKSSVFIEQLKKLFHNKYDYSLINYINYETNVQLICKEHGIFEKSPKHLLTESGCQKCSKQISNKKQTKNINILIEDFNKVHNNKYDYSLVYYKNTYTPVKIICKKHGIFEQIPRDHIRGYNCPKCKESKGENIIRNYLNENNIKYEQQKIFDGCNDKYSLKFDFYLYEYNICIEYDGLQHYKPIDYFGGLKEFNKIKKRDQIKNNYCKDKNIKLIRVPYYIKNISNYLNEKINFFYKLYNI